MKPPQLWVHPEVTPVSREHHTAILWLFEVIVHTKTFLRETMRSSHLVLCRQQYSTAGKWQLRGSAHSSTGMRLVVIGSLILGAPFASRGHSPAADPVLV